jgi:hypothetical protein
MVKMKSLALAAAMAALTACTSHSSGSDAGGDAGRDLGNDVAGDRPNDLANDLPSDLPNDLAHDLGGSETTGSNGYDDAVLAGQPVAFWDMKATASKEPDLTGNGNDGTYRGTGMPAAAAMPNGDRAADFDGASQYLTVPSKASLSIPTTGDLTWEGWIRPDVLQFTNDGGSGYVDWMGKCADYSPTCEWEARMYSTTNSQSRCNRISAYVFNPSAGLGSAADWQPVCGLLQAGHWYHVVGEYTLHAQPADCTSVASYPGSINIWVNGVEWDHSSHGQTGCMSQYMVVPQANASPLNIGTMALDTWFAGAIGKVAVYDRLLSPAEIANHYLLMTGASASGSCADTCSF